MDNQYFFLLLMAIDMCDWFLFSEIQMFDCVELIFYISVCCFYFSKHIKILKY